MAPYEDIIRISNVIEEVTSDSPTPYDPSVQESKNSYSPLIAHARCELELWKMFWSC